MQPYIQTTRSIEQTVHPALLMYGIPESFPEPMLLLIADCPYVLKILLATIHHHLNSAGGI